MNLELNKVDALSGIPFNIALWETVIDTIQFGSVINKSCQICVYADDIIIIARSVNATREVNSSIENKERFKGVKIYMQLSAIVACRRKQNIKIGEN